MATNKQPTNKNNKNNIEIDYDKLAEAMIKAQEKVNSEQSIVSKTFSLISGIFLKLLSIFGMMAGASLIIGLFCYTIQEMVWTSFSVVVSNVFMAIMIVLVALILILFSRMLFNSAKAIETEKNKQFVIAIFSGVASFAAVLVALVALIKG